MELLKSDKIIRALRKIRPNANFSVGETYSSLTWHDGGGVEEENQNKPTEQEFNDAVLAFNNDYDSKAYARERASQYPSTREQLDMIYWDKINGTEKWKEIIDKIKLDNPKPE